MNLSQYYADICKQPILTEEEERDLFLELEDEGISDHRRATLRDKVLRSNLRFVFRQAKYASKNDPSMFEELICAGNEGLLVGLEKYNPKCGVRFLTYAGWWIKQRILKQMSSMRIVSLPIYKQQLATRIQKFLDKNETATFEELKKEFPDIKEKDLRELHKTRYLTYYIEDLGSNSAFEINPIEKEVEQKLDRSKIMESIQALPSPHKEAICNLFGMIDGEERKQADVAKELGITKEKLREVRQEALEMLKDSLGGMHNFDFDVD